MPDITWDVEHLFNLLIIYHVRGGLHGLGWLCVLRMRPWADVPLSTPRACATGFRRAPNLRMASGRDPCVPRSREHEERPAAEREKNDEGWKNIPCKIPLRCMLKTDTQVPQQKPQLICVGWNTFTEAARKGFPPNIINIGFEHLSVFICSFRLWGVFGVEESVELTCQSYEMIAVNVSLILKLTAQA